jgi:hypothetical protein
MASSMVAEGILAIAVVTWELFSNYPAGICMLVRIVQLLICSDIVQLLQHCIQLLICSDIVQLLRHCIQLLICSDRVVVQGFFPRWVYIA